METIAQHIQVTGVVQGVGFRPFVYNLAVRLGLAGWVLNHSGGVDIEVEGAGPVVDTFVAALRDEAPPLAVIESLTVEPIVPPGYPAFEIRHSEQVEGRSQLLSPDVATCADCRRELFDPADRRYRYPFTNCTNCGPRFTIITDIPYDRPNTTMRVFPLCPDCRHEYEDPTDRRFHAQPNACPVCGPHLWLTDAGGQPLVAGPETADHEAVLAAVRERLLRGEILAVKGLGGFLLACDATDPAAVARLRERKRRPAKPFAVMMTDLAMVRRYCELSEEEERLLTSVQAPIVLLKRRSVPLPGEGGAELPPIAGGVAPGQRTLGVMLPYTPLHHLILYDVGRPLVMTSGNLSEEPIACDNAEALRRLGGLADGFLMHNREIHARYDDSVWAVVAAGEEMRPQTIRRARGYAPAPIRLPFATAPLLAVGPDLKNTFCLTRERYAFLSQHIGDMESLETGEHFGQTLALYRHLFRLEPGRVACDLHPGYMTTRLAERLAAALPGGAPPLRIQHHAAHIAACLVDNGWEPEAGPVIGVALDGTGYGPDGAIWGGEWLIGDYRGFRRAGQLEYLPLPGGDAAIRHPRRVALAYVAELLGAAALPADLAEANESPFLLRQLERRFNVVPTSSMGRLFDAVSALLGIGAEATYEGQAAIEMEQVAWKGSSVGSAPYPFGLDFQEGRWWVRLAPLLAALLEGVRRGEPAAESAMRFHTTVSAMVVAVCERLRADGGPATVALSGGVFQNSLLLGRLVPALKAAGFRVLWPRQVPANDGGVALGQAALAHFKISAGEA